MFNFEDIFEESYVGEEITITDEELNQFGVIECFEDEPDVACYRIALENEQNHNAIMNALMQKEFEVLESTGEVMVWESERLSQAWDWLKQQVQKFWAKVKGVFKKVVDKIASMVLTNKAFVKRYRGAGIKTPKGKKEFTGYDFGNMKIPYSDVVKVFKDIKPQLTNAKGKAYDVDVDEDYRKDAADSVRSILLGNSSGSVSKEDFTKQLREQFYGGQNTKSVKAPEFQTLLNYLENASEERKDAKEAHKEAEDAIKGFLREIKDIQNKSKNAAGDKLYKECSKMTTIAMNQMSVALSMQTKAIIAKTQQYRKMANWYVTGQSVKESADVMESVVII